MIANDVCVFCLLPARVLDWKIKVFYSILFYSMCLLFSMRNLHMKFQDYILFRNIIVAKFQGPKFRKRAITKTIS